MGSLSSSLGTVGGSMGGGGLLKPMAGLGGLVPGQQKLPAGAGGGPPVAQSSVPGTQMGMGNAFAGMSGQAGGGQFGGGPFGLGAIQQALRGLQMFKPGQAVPQASQVQQQLQQRMPQMGQGPQTPKQPSGDGETKGESKDTSGGPATAPPQQPQVPMPQWPQFPPQRPWSETTGGGYSPQVQPRFPGSIGPSVPPSGQPQAPGGPQGPQVQPGWPGPLTGARAMGRGGYSPMSRWFGQASSGMQSPWAAPPPTGGWIA